MIKQKRITITLLMILMLCSVSQAANYFRVIDGIPHLPVFTTALLPGSPAAGALVYDSTLDVPMVYSGTGWDTLCTSNAPAGNAAYFTIDNGVPVIPVHGAVGASASGSVYYSSADNTIKVYGTSWLDYESLTGLAADTDPFSTEPVLDVVHIPVRAADPAPTGLSTGAVYFNSAVNKLKYYDNALAWQEMCCSITFITRWNMAEELFTMPVQPGTYICTIDWGCDAAHQTVYTGSSPDFSHTYVEGTCGTDFPMSRDIAITGIFPGLKLSNNTTSGNKLTEIVEWGQVGFTNFFLAFRGCGILDTLPDVPIPAAGVENFGYMFDNCDLLTMAEITVPGGLFSQCPDATSFSKLFLSCSGITGTLPGNMFAGCNLVNSFQEAFSGTNITVIPANLFQDSPIVDSFLSVFLGTDITVIPPGLFDYQTLVTNFGSAFSGCLLLKGSTAIPPLLFQTNNAEIISFASTFQSCTGLETADIPPGLFDGCTAATKFLLTFAGCSGLTTIPDGLFDGLIAVTDFSQTFRTCTGLTEIDETLFDDCTLVEKFFYTFDKCTDLEAIPADLITSTKFPNVNNFMRCFSNCPGITLGEAAPALWDEYASGTVVATDCFRDSGPFLNNNVLEDPNGPDQAPGGWGYLSWGDPLN